jgi:hypothetical protein
LPAINTITFCLEQLYKDNTHWLNDWVAKDLTYEEVIGALLQGRDAALKIERRLECIEAEITAEAERFERISNEYLTPPERGSW